MIIKIYFFEIEKQKHILGKMIEDGLEYEKILEQSQKIDRLINEFVEELY